MREIVIAGGGAAGLMAALTASENPENHVLLLERQSRVGRKLLSTGNGRCNLTNCRADISHYHGEHPNFAAFALSRFGSADTLAFFGALGLVTVTEPDGRVYPYSNMANSVLDVLRFTLESRDNASTITGASVERIRKNADGFTVTAGETTFAAEAVIVACGGAAGGKLGGVMDGYQLLKALGHHRTALYPALVQLKTDPTYPRSLKGVKADAGLTLLEDGRRKAVNRGEILFTEYGVSGPAVFDLSRAAAAGEYLTLELDFWPDRTEAEVRQWVTERAARWPTAEAGQILTGAVHNRLGLVIVKAAGLSPAVPLEQLGEKDHAAIAHVCKHFPLPVTGSCGFDSAQVTAGGMCTEEFDDKTMESRLVPGLYACGEVLDIDGDCGGYNLQWAWASGRLAGESIG